MGELPIDPENIQDRKQNPESSEIGEDISNVVGKTRHEASKRLKKRRLRYSERGEVEEGYMEYLSTPKSKEALHPELAFSFEIEATDNPLRRRDIEKEVENYVDQNFEEMLQISLSSQTSYEALIKKLNLTNEQIGLLGANYFLREENGEQAIFQTDEDNPEGRRVYMDDYDGISDSDLLALAYARDAIRIDTQNEANRVGGKVPHRYCLKSKDRYLCKNDYGMRVWDEEEGKMVEGKAENVAPFVKTIKHQFERILENFRNVVEELENRIQEEVSHKIKIPNFEDFEDLNEYYAEEKKCEQQIEQIVIKRVSQELLEQFVKNPGDKKLVLESVPARKIRDHLHFHYHRIALKYGLISNNAVADYENFIRYRHKRINRLIKKPSEKEKTDTSIQFLHSDFYKKPFIVSDYFQTNDILEEAKSGIKDILAFNAAQADEETKTAFERYRCGRGEQSPYFYHDYQIYNFIRLVGAGRVEQILDRDDRNVSEQMTSYEYIQAMGYNISRFEPNKLRKQLHEAHKLDRSQIWEYLQKRESKTIEKAKERLGEKATGKHWLELLGRRKAKDLFREGKRMYWLALQVYMRLPRHNDDDRFYHQDASVNWDRYDLSKVDLPEVNLSEFLDKHKNLIIALLGEGTKQGRYREQQETKGTSATLGLIMTALESGQDLRGVAIAHDKQRYLEGLIKGGVTDDLEFALQDWPVEWKESVSKEEIDLYYEYSSDYVQLDPNGLAKYAAWRATHEGKEWEKVFTEAPEQKSDLDFRICLGSQTEEIRGWYKSGAEYVGSAAIQSYLMRFNATRDTGGQIANWHDVLFWVPNISKLESTDAKSVLSSIQTMDDNQEFVQLLPRYSKERDPFAEQEGIQSIRELKKRILAIESNIDLSTFPPELFEIMTAPGFNLSALESMRGRADFQDLLEGKLDAEQPFKPHKRLFSGRALTEALQEGLGSYKKKIRGTAKSSKKLFHDLKQLIGGRTVGKKKMQVTDLLDNVPIDLEEEVLRLLQDQNVNVGPIIEAQIHPKSDPDGWVCGNYTDCCMPFGASNNTGYMFNPSTQYFTVKYNGRIVAQSVVVDGRDSRDDSDVVILDNIEVANNYKRLTPLLAKAYQTFWSEYTGKPVKAGTGYSDLTPPGGKLEPNNYRPKTRLGYSDATGSQIYDFPKIRGIESMDEIVTFANLTERDAELIAKMETEAYPEGMTQGKAHILDIIKKQRELDVPGAASSFVIRQGDEAAGYLLVLPEKSEVKPGERVAHVHDMVILPKFQGTGLAKKMMQRVLDVATAYNVSIEAEARASTSYTLLMNERVRTWLESNGFHLTKNEKLPEYLGDEDFYFVRFENRQGEAV